MLRCLIRLTNVDNTRKNYISNDSSLPKTTTNKTNNSNFVSTLSSKSSSHSSLNRNSSYHTQFNNTKKNNTQSTHILPDSSSNFPNSLQSPSQMQQLTPLANSTTITGQPFPLTNTKSNLSAVRSASNFEYNPYEDGDLDLAEAEHMPCGPAPARSFMHSSGTINLASRNSNGSLGQPQYHASNPPYTNSGFASKSSSIVGRSKAVPSTIEEANPLGEPPSAVFSDPKISNNSSHSLNMRTPAQVHPRSTEIRNATALDCLKPPSALKMHSGPDESSFNPGLSLHMMDSTPESAPKPIKSALASHPVFSPLTNTPPSISVDTPTEFVNSAKQSQHGQSSTPAASAPTHNNISHKQREQCTLSSKPTPSSKVHSSIPSEPPPDYDLHINEYHNSNNNNNNSNDNIKRKFLQSSSGASGLRLRKNHNRSDARTASQQNSGIRQMMGVRCKDEPCDDDDPE